MTDLILDLDQFTEPSGIIRTGGNEYRLVQWGALNLLEQKDLARRWSRIFEIEAKPKIDEKTARQYDRDVRELVMAISDMPSDVAETMPLEKLGRAIAGFFIQRARSTREQSDALQRMLGVSALSQETQTNGDGPTGESSSPDSTSPTAEGTG